MKQCQEAMPKSLDFMLSTVGSHQRVVVTGVLLERPLAAGWGGIGSPRFRKQFPDSGQGHWVAGCCSRPCERWGQTAAGQGWEQEGWTEAVAFKVYDSGPQKTQNYRLEVNLWDRLPPQVRVLGTGLHLWTSWPCERLHLATVNCFWRLSTRLPASWRVMGTNSVRPAHAPARSALPARRF